MMHRDYFKVWKGTYHKLVTKLPVFANQKKVLKFAKGAENNIN
tara:strand:+ start:309 stop:437 length:129 start_codon:yes stop_codon:yes gene_type:complete